MALLYKNEIKGGNIDLFEKKVIDISEKLGIDPNWLMIVMKSESGLNSKARNEKHLVEGKPATGLIQFVNSTAIGLGTTVEQLYAMSNVEQLDYVYKYFKRFAFKMNSVYDLYLVTFFPVAVGKSDDWILQSSGKSANSIARSNPAIDLNKSNSITVGEFKQFVKNKIPANYQDSYIEQSFSRSSKGFFIRNKNQIIGVVIVLIIIALVFYYYKKFGFKLSLK